MGLSIKGFGINNPNEIPGWALNSVRAGKKLAPPKFISKGTIGSMHSGDWFSYQVDAISTSRVHPTTTREIRFEENPVLPLPEGLTISTDGLISGNPIGFGTKTFQIVAKEYHNGRYYSSAGGNLKIILSNTAPTWTTPAGSLGSFHVGTSQSIELVGTDADSDAISFELASGTLPDGMSIVGNVLTGTLTTIGSYSFDLNISDGFETNTRSFTINVGNTKPEWNTPEGSLGEVHIGNSYLINVSASDPDGDPIIYSLANGTTLPTGMTLNTNTGIITGVPTTLGVTNFDIAANDSYEETIGSFSLETTNVPPTWITPSTHLGDIHINAPASFLFEASDLDGDAISYTLQSGQLPVGMTLSATGELTGTPTTQASYNFTIEASDGFESTTRMFSIGVINTQPIWITATGSLGEFHINAYNEFKVEAQDVSDADQLSYSLTSGSLPTGMSLSNTGVISGVPNTLGIYNFTITVSDSYDSVPRTFSAEITNAAPVWETSGDIGDYHIGEYHSIVFQAPDVNNDKVVYTLSSGTLPEGMVLLDNGTLYGLPITLGTYTFDILASDPYTSSSSSFSMNITNNAPVWVSPAAGSLGDYQADDYATISLTASDADGDPITFSVSSGALPDGMFLNEYTGIISGTPTVLGTYNFTISASDPFESTDRAFSLVVDNDIPVWSSPVAGDMGTYHVGDEQSFTFVATDANDDAITYSLSTGTLPDGMDLSNDGILSGIPTTTGVFNYTISATDIHGGSADRAFSITIGNNAPVWVSPAHGSDLGTYDAGEQLYIPISATDADGDSIKFSIDPASTDDPGLNFTDTHIIGSIGSDNAPSWTTSHTLQSVDEKVTYSETLAATPNTTTTSPIDHFSVTSGYLPFGLTLNTQTGEISGTVAEINSTVDESYIVGNGPSWVTTSGSLGIFEEDEIASINIQANSSGGRSIEYYSIVDGYVPRGLVLNTNTTSKLGVISGTTASINDVENPYFYNSNISWNINGGLLKTTDEGDAISISVTATPENGRTIERYYVKSGFLPRGTTLNSQSGLISGTTLELMPTDDTAGVELYEKPIWETISGTLGTFDEGETINTSLIASPFSGSSLDNYSIISGYLPSGISLNSLSGEISGEFAEIKNSTDNVFTIDDAPVWQTPLGSLGAANEDDVVNIAISATPRIDRTIERYSITDGYLPFGLSLNSQSGLISGTQSQITPSTDESFTIPLKPIWARQEGTLGTWEEGESITLDLQAKPNTGRTIEYYSIVDGYLPNGLVLQTNTTSKLGIISGTTLEINPSNDPAFYYNTSPTWVTAGGSLDVVYEGDPISVSVEADPVLDRTIERYFLIDGALPRGTYLNSLTGAILGTAEELMPTDNTGGIEIPEKPTWTTPPGDLGTFEEDTVVNDVNNNIISINALPTGTALLDNYSIISGYLPSGLTLDSSNGEISGKVSEMNPSNDPLFFYNTPPVWDTSTGSLDIVYEGDLILQTVSASPVENRTIERYTLVDGYLPRGTFLDPLTGTIVGTTEELMPTDNTGGIEIPEKPTWETPSGTLGTFEEFEEVTPSEVIVNASPYSGSTLDNYSIIAGYLPSGLTLDSETGSISGTLSEMNPSTDPVWYRDNIPSWITGGNVTSPTGTMADPINIGTMNEEDSFTITLNASFDTGRTASRYTITEGYLPHGLYLNSLTGEISGQSTEILTADYSEFVIPNAPVWNTVTGLLDTFNEGDTVSLELDAIGQNGKVVEYYSVVNGYLPTGLVMTTNTTTKKAIISGDVADINPSTGAPYVLGGEPTITTTSDLGSYNISDTVSITLAATLTAGRSEAKWVVTSGYLPFGLSLNTSTGVISGNIASNANVETYNFDIILIDNEGARSTPVSFTITVA